MYNQGAQKKIVLYYLSLCIRKPTIWVPTRSDTNRPVQSQKMVRSLKFRILEEEELYYPRSENKGADQLRICAFVFAYVDCFFVVVFFSCGSSFLINSTKKKQTKKNMAQNSAYFRLMLIARYQKLATLLQIINDCVQKSSWQK